MKKQLLTLLIPLLLLSILTGCKEAVAVLGVQPTEDILGNWQTTESVDIGGGVIVLTANIEITRTSYNANYSFAASAFNWAGSVAPDPSTSISSTVIVLYSFDTDIVATETVYTLSYSFSDIDTAIIVLGGKTFPVTRVSAG